MLLNILVWLTSFVAGVKPPVVTQIGDGQVQAPKNATTPPIQFEGAASVITFNSAIVAAVLGLASVLLL